MLKAGDQPPSRWSACLGVKPRREIVNLQMVLLCGQGRDAPQPEGAVNSGGAWERESETDYWSESQAYL